MNNNRDVLLQEESVKKTKVSFIPAVNFSPHAKKVIKTCWHEVFLWFPQFQGAELEIYMVSDKKIREVNKQYRQLDKVTDVISLDFGNGPDQQKLGVIYLASGMLKKMARHFQHTLEAEIVFLTLHGILHIWGYDHEKKADEDEMLAATKIVLENFPQYAPLLATYKRRSLIDY